MLAIVSLLSAAFFMCNEATGEKDGLEMRVAIQKIDYCNEKVYLTIELVDKNADRWILQKVEPVFVTAYDTKGKDTFSTKIQFVVSDDLIARKAKSISGSYTVVVPLNRIEGLYLELGVSGLRSSKLTIPKQKLH